MTKIKFGTSGWRAILADEFTLENVRIVCQAISDYLKEKNETNKGVIIGYDTRFMGKRFAQEAAMVLAANNIKAFLCDRDTPTPVIAYYIIKKGLNGGINFTASHNPSEYNGIKFSPASGGPALPETTKRIEELANQMMGEIAYSELSFEEGRHRHLIEEIDARDEYMGELKNKIDFKIIKKAGIKVATDFLYGTSRGYLDSVLLEAGCKVTTLHGYLDPYFGGNPPEPAEENIKEISDLVAEDEDICLGLATDLDADRFGIIDSDGSYIEPNQIIALLLDYLIRVKGWKGGVARSVATTHLIDAVAKKHGIEVHETPVGFKYIGELITKDKIVIGGEESAGLSIKGHIPEKDGILACLLVTEMVAREGKSVKELLYDLYKQVGTIVTRRENIKLTLPQKEAFQDKLSSTPDSFAGLKIKGINRLDGTKFIMEDEKSWLLMRESGTEPVVRLYGEAESDQKLNHLMEAGKEFILS
ncbi:MAG: phosphoglucomutase/phosphomannomutase family protein [Proteobacteria bacterium]|nr:phosphoglucomutase/phosphomannomutase family protein [Pseudomonadota bacterium]